MPKEQDDRDVNDAERRATSELVSAANQAAKEGTLVAERLRLATQQYRDRLNPKKGGSR